MIYVVEDDASIRELVVYTLQSTGFEVNGFDNGNDFVALYKITVSIVGSSNPVVKTPTLQIIAFGVFLNHSKISFLSFSDS